jgi:uncharacterized membrane protein YkoI
MTSAIVAFGFGVVLAAAAAGTSGAPAEQAAPKRPDQTAPKRVCLSSAETREIVLSRKLSPPFNALRTAATHAHGETIGVHLCRFGEDLVYEVTVLRRDGRVVKVLVDAVTGKITHLPSER